MISVVLPVFNAGSYVGKSIESILNQSYSQFELIVINDGSSDESEEVILELAEKDSRIRYYSQENKGLVYTLNHAVSLSRFNFIARMDADDIACLDRFDSQLNYLLDNNSVGVVGGHIQLIDENDNLGRTIYFPTSTLESRDYSLISVPVAHPASMFRKSIFHAAGQYRSEFKHAEDYDLWLRMLKHCEIANVDKVLLNYRVHAQSVSSLNSREQKASTLGALVCNSLDLDPREVKNNLFEKGLSINSNDNLTNLNPLLKFRVQTFMKDRIDIHLLLKWLRYTTKSKVFARYYINILVSLFKRNHSYSYRLKVLSIILYTFCVFPYQWFRKARGYLI